MATVKAVTKGSRSAACLALLVAAAAGSACGVSTPSTNMVLPFSGTVGVGQIAGSISHQFSSSGTGDLIITLTALSPDANATVGIGYGQPVSGGCLLISTVNIARVGTKLSAVAQKGTFCASIYDVGFLTVPEQYTITVSHP
jgi:hypothetical protein